MTFCAGLAAGGLKPFCNIYSSFAQRAYDQIVHDVALQKLPVVLCLDRAGLVGEDGATHHGVLDIAALRCVPNTIISAPKDEWELKMLMYTALKQPDGPFIIRYPRGMGEGVSWEEEAFEELPVGKAVTLMEGDKIALICTGPVVNRALEAAATFPGRVGVYNFRYVKPLDEETLKMIASRYRHIITAEDGSLKGGLFGAVSELLESAGCGGVTVEGLGVPDRFIPQAGQSAQLHECGLDKEGLEKRLKIYFEDEK